MRRAMIVPLTACAIIAAGCSSSIDGTPVAAKGVAESIDASETSTLSPTEPEAAASPASSKPTDCDSLTRALGPLVSDRPDVSEQTLPGYGHPMCVWSKDSSSMAGALTVIVREEAHDAAVLAEMPNVGGTVPDPRADALGGVVLDVVGLALLTPTHNIMANSIDTGVDDAKKLDVLFAVAEYLAE